MARTNFCTHPSFELDTNGDGLSDGCSGSGGATATVVWSRVSGRIGGYAQRYQITPIGAGGDIYPFLMATTPVGSMTPGSVVTASFYFRGTSNLASLFLNLSSRNDDGSFASTSTINLAPLLRADWARISLSHTVAADKTRVAVYLLTSVHAEQAADLTFDDLLLEKAAALAPYFDGSYDGCYWSGAVNASTSLRPTVVPVSPLVYRSGLEVVSWQ